MRQHKGLRNKFIKWKEAFESKGLKVNLGKTKVMVNGDITKDGLLINKVDPRMVVVELSLAAEDDPQKR